MSACCWRDSGWKLVLAAILTFRMRVRSQTFAKKNDSNAYFSEFLGANGRKIYLNHDIGVQMGENVYLSQNLLLSSVYWCD